MEILINELSLSGQFATIQHFVNNGLIPFISVLKELNISKDVVLKKYDFWNSQITPTDNLHGIFVHKSDEITRFKAILSRLIDEPFWENSQKQNLADYYECNGNNISYSSIAESCERDKVVISFIHVNFSSAKLRVLKNNKPINVNNLFSKEHYIEVANSNGQIDRCEYFERKFAFGQITLIENECRFRKTNLFPQQGKPVYEEISMGRYWYLDNLHKNHYEVFDINGLHIGEANLQGFVDHTKKDRNKTITLS